MPVVRVVTVRHPLHELPPATHTRLDEPTLGVAQRLHEVIRNGEDLGGSLGDVEQLPDQVLVVGHTVFARTVFGRPPVRDHEATVVARLQAS